MKKYDVTIIATIYSNDDLSLEEIKDVVLEDGCITMNIENPYGEDIDLELQNVTLE
jgi:hypothetical protein